MIKFILKAWSLPQDSEVLDKTLIVINNDKKITAKSFLDYLSARQRNVMPLKPVSKYADAVLEQYIDDQLNVYYNDHLEDGS